MHEYLSLDLILLALWLYLYWARKDLRGELFFSSLICLPLGIAEIWFVPVYWNPESIFALRIFGNSLYLESFLFTFATGGIAAVLYEEVLKKHLSKRRESKHKEKTQLYIATFTASISLIVFSLLFQRGLIYSGSAAMATTALAILAFRRDLIKESIMGSILFAVIYIGFFSYVNAFIFPGWVERVYNLDGLLGIMFLGIPIEELFWALSFGALWAPMYEDLRGYRIK